MSFARTYESLRSTSPLVERSLANAPPVSSPTRATRNIRLTSIRSETLFALGIFLIELCFKQPFSSLQKPDDKIQGGLLECLTEFVQQFG